MKKNKKIKTAKNGIVIISVSAHKETHTAAGGGGLEEVHEVEKKVDEMEVK